MKRMHIHLAVADLAQSVDFYSRLFNTAPSVQHADYAKWMIDDPRINFAISARGAEPGLDHLGIQVDADSELQDLAQQFEQADLSMLTQSGEACCYARSDKHWLTDPQGIAWEHFRSLESIPTFNEAGASCAPATPSTPTQNTCCAPQSSSGKSSCC